MNSQPLEKLQQILAVTTSHDLEEIGPETRLEEDLGVNMLEDFPSLMAMINSEFELKLQIEDVLNELEEAEETVEVLAKLIEEEIELG